MYLNKIALVLCACVVNCDVDVLEESSEKEHSFEVLAGSDVDLPCDLGQPDMALRQKALVRWYKEHEQNTSKDESVVYSYDGRNAKSAAEARRWSSSALVGRARFEPARGALHVRGVRVSDSARYRCYVDHSGLPERITLATLSVIDSPTKLTILDSRGTVANNRQLGPYYEGDTFDITCVVRGGNPQPWVRWWMGTRLVGESWRAVSSQRTRNVYRVGPLQRQDAGAELSCRTGQQDGRTVLNASVWIQLKLSPVSVVLYSVESVAALAGSEGTEGADRAAGGEVGGVEFRCEVKGAFPTPPVTWYRDGSPVDYKQNITVLEDESYLFSSVWLEVSTRDHGSNVTCCSGHDRHGAGGRDGGWHDRHNQTEQLMCSSRMISLTFPPLLEMLVNDTSSTTNVTSSELMVQEGATVILTCLQRANPSVHSLEWYFNNTTSQVIRSCMAPYELECPVLTLTVSRANTGLYQCRANNDAGAGATEPFLLNVTYPPRCVNEDIMEYGVGSDADAPLNLSCNMDSLPWFNPERYYWFYFNNTIDNMDNNEWRSLQWLPLPEHSSANLQIEINDNSSYGTLACWVGASLEWESGGAPCVFSLRPLSRPHAPRNCHARVLTPATLPQLHVSCDEGNDGGLPQEFQLDVVSKESSEVISSIRSKHPHFTAELEDVLQQYSIRVSASNQLGDSTLVELADLELDVTVSNHSVGGSGVGVVGGAVGVTLQRVLLWLAGSVCALVLVACGAALLAVHAPTNQTHRAHCDCGCGNTDPIYQCQESERGSQGSLRRTDSFRRALTPRCHNKVYEVVGVVGGAPNTLHLPKLDTPMSRAEAQSVYGTMRTCNYNSDFRKLCVGAGAGAGVCRVHSVRSVCGGGGGGGISEYEGAGDAAHDGSLMLHLPNDFPNYSIPKPTVPFVTQTLPRRVQNRSGDFSTSFGPSSLEELPLPPPPIATATGREYSNVVISPLNTVGLPAPSTTSFYRGTEQPSYEKDISTPAVTGPHSTLHF